MIWISHPTGNTFVRALLTAMTESGQPFHFFTTFGVAESTRWPGLLPVRLRTELQRRSYRIHRGRLTTRPGRELARLCANAFGWRDATRHETGPFSIDAVYHDLDAALGKRLRNAPKAALPKAVYCYEDAALETFKSARARGVHTIYELPIAYWETSRRLLDEEARRHPDWEPTLLGTRDSPAKLERKTGELQLADAVVCPSLFVLGSLPDRVRATKKCFIAPFGSPASDIDYPFSSKLSNCPFRFLFAGAMTQRKGLADLFQAASLLRGRKFELVVMGSALVPMAFYRDKLHDFVYEPPRPHDEVMKLMATCDVLVLPSIVEGRALVQQEALRNGLPLIVTANAGGEDLIDEGKTGFLVPIRSAESIAEKMVWFLDHPADIEPMREAARRKAALFTWADYGSRILSLIKSMG